MEHRRSYRRIRACQNKVSRENITDELNPSEMSTVITDGLSIGNYGIGGNFLATLCEIPKYLSVKPSVCNHRRNMSVGNYGMASNCLATLYESPTDIICRQSRRHIFKINI
jgi:hypothetical protein